MLKVLLRSKHSGGWGGGAEGEREAGRGGDNLDLAQMIISGKNYECPLQKRQGMLNKVAVAIAEILHLIASINLHVWLLANSIMKETL